MYCFLIVLALNEMFTVNKDYFTVYYTKNNVAYTVIKCFSDGLDSNGNKHIVMILEQSMLKSPEYLFRD